MDEKTPPSERKKTNLGKPFAKGPDPRRSNGSNPIRNEAGKKLTQLARDFTPKAFERLVSIIEDPEAADRDVITAISLVFTRGHGMPSQQMKIEGTIQHEVATVDPAKLSSEMRRAILAARQELLTPPPVLIEDGSFIEVSPLKGIDE